MVLDMKDFWIIHKMNGLAAYYTTMDCLEKKTTLYIPS